ncbi:MAG: hypothetical protein P8184_17550 [Calditrichia bacterium]
MKVIRFLAGLFIFGGIVRIVATSGLFSVLGMGDLWVDHAYFIYIYKVLGGFVILTGLLLWSLAGKAGEWTGGLRMMKWGMVIVGLVMLVTGWWSGLNVRFFLIDVVFSWLVAVLLHREQRQLAVDRARENYPYRP